MTSIDLYMIPYDIRLYTTVLNSSGKWGPYSYRFEILKTEEQKSSFLFFLDSKMLTNLLISTIKDIKKPSHSDIEFLHMARWH